MHGKWVGCGTCEAPWISGEFSVEKPANTVIDICGLGFFELYLNGKKVSEDVLVPACSDYSSRKGQRLKYPIQDDRSYQVYFCRYDISDFLKKGVNIIEVLLGNGWYHQYERTAEGEMWYGRPKLWFEIKVQSEAGERVICSGEWLKWRPSQIVYNNIYIGEVQDFTAGVRNDLPVELVEAPEGELRLQECPPDRVIRKITPKFLQENGGKKIYDAGENITGWVTFIERENEGREVTVRYAEELNEEGVLDFASTGGLKQVQRDIYISAGTEKKCGPHFTWHGFRYFDIEGEVENVCVQVVHSDVAVTGHFRCSDENINWLVDAYLRSRLTNMHCGVPMDCPHRERLGYTGDGQAVCGSDFWMLDGDAFYRKWMEDIAAGQCKISGHVQHTAPFYGGGGGPGGWGGAMVLVPWEHYRRYRDQKILEKYYPNMCHYIRYMYSRCDENGLVVREEEKGWCLGDWCAPERMELPNEFVNTYYLIRCLSIVLDVAKILGEDCPYTTEDLERTKEAFRDRFYDSVNNCYANGIQGADSFALDIGLGNREMADAIAERYGKEPAFDTGFLGTGILIRQLFLQGHGDVAIKLLKSEAPGQSYGWQRKQGATTLWERWNGHESHNHPMFGSPVQWLFEGLLGIRVQDGLKIQPLFTEELSWTEGKANTVYGPVWVKWQRNGENILVDIEVSNVAELLLPKDTIRLEPGTYHYEVSV